MNALKSLLILFAIFNLTACQTLIIQQKEITTSQQQINNSIISNLFTEAKTNGVITIYDGNHYASYGNNVARANTYYVPASTFKMLNAVIGIESGLTNPNEVFKWNGEKRPLKAWEKDLTLTEAIKVSAVPVYQQLARRIGLEKMRLEVERIGFGNSNIGNKVDDFWLVGPLEITPKQEAEFAFRLANKELPVSYQTQKQVNEMLFDDVINGSRIYGKTGLAINTEPKIGWFTGWVVKPNNQVISFSLNMDMTQDIAFSKRKEIAYESLKQLGII
ncbi:class D beta-lactamase [Psychrobacter sp. I-STPA10]|uniref:class D beta-lactamase n=1 Tax=Psychrobacter sp. I-STPA10 TaxID=2585769 RepID=UPI001E3DA48D|nr:class D beta-lactamase [Psychrobacter sp. I-STPA10]